VRILFGSTAPGSTFNVNGQAAEYLLGRDAIFSSDFTGNRERTGANISLQFAPNDDATYTFETFYNSYKNQSFNSLLFSFVDWWQDHSGAPLSAADANIELFDNTNIIRSRSTLNNWSFTSGDLTTSETESVVYSFGGEWNLSENLTLKSELVYQDSTYETDFVGMRYEGARYGTNVNFNDDGGIPAFNFMDNPNTPNLNEADVADIANWKSAQLYDNANKNSGDATTFTSDLTYIADQGFFTKFAGGIRVDQRNVSESFSRQEGFNGAIPLTPEMTHVNSGFFDGNADIPTTWAVVNGSYLRKNIGAFRDLYNLDALALDRSFGIEELTTSAYATAQFETEVAGRRLDGEIGLRYTAYDTDMEFVDLASADRDIYRSSADSSKVLPSLSLRYAITDDLQARFAYTETSRRPNFNQLNSQIIYNQDVSNVGYGTANGGNPNLKSTESQNYDLSLEWYFAEGSSLYATLFQRDIEGFVVPLRKQIQGPKLDGTLGTFILDQPTNASSGELKGLELGLIWFPENLPGVLDGLGVQASYTGLESSQSTPMTNAQGDITGYDETDMFGVSDESYTVVLAYEREKLGMRLSYTWRSEFLARYEAALFANPLEIWNKPEQTMDFQLSYQVLDNLSLTLDGTNLTEEIYQSYYGANGATTNNFGSSLYSRTFAIGARYTF
jgi:iron complex outermembrane receptor protein